MYKSRDSNEKAPSKERFANRVAADYSVGARTVTCCGGGCCRGQQLLYKSRDSNEKAPLKERFANRVAAD